MNAHGLYYDGEHARPVEVLWSASGGALRIEGEGVSRHEQVAALRGTTRLGGVRRAVFLPDGAQLHSDDQGAVDALFPRRGLETLVDRLERHPAAVAGGLLLSVLAIVLFATHGLPWLAERVARAMPPDVEAPLGAQVMAALDALALEPSTLDPAEQARWRAAFEGFMAGRPDAARLRLEFRDLGGGAANAFAVPGGTIVFTDGLLRTIRFDEEFLAVLAHELGHHADRHVLRTVLQQSAVAVLLAVFTGDVGSATGVTVAIPTFLLDNHYSRDFEREADAFAFRELAARGISPAWFAVVLSRIAGAADGNGEDEPDHDYASSHPATGDRLAAAREAGRGAAVLDVAQAAARAGETPGRPQWPARVAVSTPELAGCWAGRLDDAEWPYEWFAERAADGGFVVDFRGFPDTPSEDFEAREQGTWAVEDGVLATHSWQTGDGTGGVGGDAVWTYRIEAFDGRRLVYRAIGDGNLLFEAVRADCKARPFG
ncbi:MAG: M48 family metallopeptidase [Pseudomonadota bacterium]